MKYLEGMIPKTVRELRDHLVWASVYASRDFPQDRHTDFDGAFYENEMGVENLRKRFGDAKADQLIDMIRQAKRHFEQDDGLGARLLQDVQMVAVDRPPYAYPKRLYRWPRPVEEINPASTPVSSAHRVLFERLVTLQELNHEYPGEDFSRDRESFSDLIRSFRAELGSAGTDQLLDMMQQVEAHYREGAPGYGSMLLQDIRRMLCGMRVPFSYWRERFRWPRKLPATLP